MPSFGQVALPDINPLFDLASADQGINKIQLGRIGVATGNQDLADRSTLRSLAGGLAGRDPTAEANAVVLPGGASAVGTLSNADAQTAQSKLNMLQFQNQQISFPDGSSPPGMPGQGGFMQQLGASEGGNNSAAVNPQGYSGQFQFGAARLSDLPGAAPGSKLYTPAQGENLKANEWKGTFNIPGHPEIQTHDQFLASPTAQRAAFGEHVAGIDQAIASTPGASGMDQNGLRAVAHLGGVEGMQRFVQTGGLYNPADKNGTRLSDYYQKFAQGGHTALQSAFGHPDGPIGSAPAAAAPVAAAAAPGVAAPYQVASADGINGQPPAMTDAVPDTGAPAAAPGAQGQADVLARLRAAQGAPAAPGGVPDVPNANPLLGPAMAGAGAPAGAPAAPAAAPAAPQGQPAGNYDAPPGTVFARTGPGAVNYVTTGAPPGMAVAKIPNGQGGYTIGFARIPGLPPQIKSTPVGGFMINTDERTGQEVSRFPIPDAGRQTVVAAPGGNQVWQSGKPIATVPYSGRPEQVDAYKSDIPQATALAGAANQAQMNAPRLNEMASLAQGLATGPTGEWRAKAASYLEESGVSPEAIKRFTGMSSGAAAQEFLKLNLTAAGAASKADVGANNGIESVKLYQSANPGLALLPDANKRITNMMRVAGQATQDYAAGALEHFNKGQEALLHGGDYEPLTSYNQKWLGQNNPQVYAAATGMLNGDPFEKWSSKISPADGLRAASIVARIDPGAMVPAPGGGMKPVRDILAHGGGNR